MRNNRLLDITLTFLIPPMTRHSHHVRIMRDIKLATEILRPQKRHHNRIRKYTAHEDADDFTVLVAMLRVLGWREWEALAESRFDGRGSRRDEVA